jgi:DNA-directed RNA polymerase subunit RPC12/RpoP
MSKGNGKSTPSSKKDKKPSRFTLGGQSYQKESDVISYSAPWICSSCGKRYHMRNFNEFWAPSLTNGIQIWQKIRVKRCLSCDQKRTMKMVQMFVPQVEQK